MKLNPPLLALAAGAFGIGVTEFAPMGLLPVIATDLGVSIPSAGLLISAYALGVVLGAPLMTLATGRVPRRTLLIGLAGIFTIGNALSALADNYALLMIARIITSLNHGAFFGVGAIVAAGLVPPDRKAGAVAAMPSGSSDRAAEAPRKSRRRMATGCPGILRARPSGWLRASARSTFSGHRRSRRARSPCCGGR